MIRLFGYLVIRGSPPVESLQVEREGHPKTREAGESPVARCVSAWKICLRFHIIFGTKTHYPFLTGELNARMHQYVMGIVKTDGGVPIAVGGRADHIHLLLSLRPDRAVSDVVRVVKSNSSKWAHETFRELEKFAWQDGYGAFTVSESNVETVRKYIMGQEEHHRKVLFREEYVTFLRKQGIPFDERYVKG